MTESDPYPGVPGKHSQAILGALRGMEQSVLRSGTASDTEGIVLRYGVFHGSQAPHTRAMVRLAKLWMMPVVGGGGIQSWIELGDVATATVAAATRGCGGEIYNIVDDHPVAFRDYLNALSTSVRRPRPVTIPLWLARLGAPYAALAFGGTALLVSNAKARKQLQWEPRFGDYRTAISATVNSG